MQGQESRLGLSGLILSLLPLSSSPQPTLAPGILTSTFAPPPTSVSRAERLIPSCQPAWKKESRLPGGRGMARVTLGGPFLKEPPRTSPTGFPRGTAVFGEIKMVCAGWLSHGFLCLTFPPPCTLMSLSLLFAQPC